MLLFFFFTCEKYLFTIFSSLFLSFHYLNSVPDINNSNFLLMLGLVWLFGSILRTLSIYFLFANELLSTRLRINTEALLQMIHRLRRRGTLKIIVFK